MKLTVFGGTGGVGRQLIPMALGGGHSVLAYVRNPAPFVCARVTAWVGEDALLPLFGGGPALLVAQQVGMPESATATAQALYCDVVTIGVGELFP